MKIGRRSALAAMLVVSMAATGALTPKVKAHGAANGGQVQQIGPFEAELVVKGSEVSLYVLDSQDKKVDVSKFAATAVVLAKGNEQKTIELQPAGDNRLAGKVDFAFDGKFRATVTLKSPAGEAGKGRYALDAIR